MLVLKLAQHFDSEISDRFWIWKLARLELHLPPFCGWYKTLVSVTMSLLNRFSTSWVLENVLALFVSIHASLFKILELLFCCVRVSRSEYFEFLLSFLCLSELFSKRCMVRKDLSAKWLSEVNFTVFGLGDSGYPKYRMFDCVLCLVHPLFSLLRLTIQTLPDKIFKHHIFPNGIEKQVARLNSA